MLNMIAATRAEADPVINAMKLRHAPGSFPLFCSDTTSLVVSGIGKPRAAAACAWLAAMQNIGDDKRTNKHSRARPPTVWINFGIAGHSDAAIGSIFTAHKITDHHSGHVWYPPQIHSPLRTCDLLTVDKPLPSYQPARLHDMEASGFIQIARMFAHAELVQSVKIVSDNKESSLRNITAEFALTLVTESVPSINTFAEHLVELSSRLHIDTAPALDLFCNHWRFTVSQTAKLDRLLQRYSVINGQMTSIPVELLKQSLSPNKVLQYFEDELSEASYST